MNMVNIKRKQIAFNLDDPLQSEMYKYISKFSNFSFYGKSIIQKDMNGISFSSNNQNHKNEDENSDSKVKIDNSIAKGFI